MVQAAERREARAALMDLQIACAAGSSNSMGVKRLEGMLIKKLKR
jgi:hypothetical protein